MPFASLHVHVLRSARHALVVFACVGVASVQGCSSGPPRVKDPLLTAADRTLAPGLRVQASREAIARAGDDPVAQRAVYEGLAEIVWSSSEDDMVRAGAFASLQAVQTPQARELVRAGIAANIGRERDPAMLTACSALAAREGWTDAVPGLVLALARPHIIKSDGWGVAGPRVSQRVNIRFGGSDDAALLRNLQAGAALPAATSDEALAQAKQALGTLLALPDGGGIERLWQFVVAPAVALAEKPAATEKAGAVKAGTEKAGTEKVGAEKAGSKPQPPAAGPQGLEAPKTDAQRAAASLQRVRTATQTLEASRDVERLRLAAYDVLVRHAEADGAWPGANVDALVASSDASTPVVARLLTVKNALQWLPQSAEQLRHLLSLPAATSDGAWWTVPAPATAGSALTEPVFTPRTLGTLAALQWGAAHLPQEADRQEPVTLLASIFQSAMQQPGVREALRQQLALDASDRSASYGGWLVPSQTVAGQAGELTAVLAAARPADRVGDFVFSPSDAMLTRSANALAWYRLDPEPQARGTAITPTPRDRWLASTSGRPMLIVSSVGGDDVDVQLLTQSQSGAIEVQRLGVYALGSKKEN